MHFPRNPVSVDSDSEEWIFTSTTDCISAVYDDTSHMEVSIIASVQSSLNQIQVVSWDKIKAATVADPYMSQLKKYILEGFPETPDELALQLQPYWRYRSELSVVDDVIMYDDRIVVPPPLRRSVCDILHSAHQGTNAMSQRARATVFWPGISLCINRTRMQCDTCCRLAPSQPHLPPAQPFVPTYPFQAIAADFCSVRGNQYLITVDRFSNWPEVYRVKPGSHSSGSRGLLASLRSYFTTFGVVEELSSDGGPEFVAHDTQDFLRRWGVKHRLSSAYNPRSNGRAEVAVKSMKRLLQDNTSADGSILNDSFTRAMLQFRNCPDPANGISPAEIVFGRSLKDALPINPHSQVFNNRRIRPMWRRMWENRERTLRTRFAKQVESLQSKTKSLSPLLEGDVCRIQNQCGRFPLRWDKTGRIIQCLENDQYLVKIDGSGRISLRNRRHLRKVEPFFRVGLGLPTSACTHSSSTAPDISGTTQPAPMQQLTSSDFGSPPVGSSHQQPSALPEQDSSLDNSLHHTKKFDFDHAHASETSEAQSRKVHDERRQSGLSKRPPSWHDDYGIGTVHLR